MAANGYPKISAKAWKTLRAKAATAPTTKFTVAGVGAIMSMSSPKSAQDNIVTPMRRLGLIDEDGGLTDLGNRWRLDGSYSDACDEIISSVYPEELAALNNSDGAPDAEQVKTWFDHKGFGESNARNMANTYIMIARKEVPDAPASEPAKKTPSRKPSTSAKQVPPRVAEPTAQSEPQTPVTPPSQAGPSLHIDIQIHIPSDADPEQIDQIFASMAKHLYPQQAGE